MVPGVPAWIPQSLLLLARLLKIGSYLSIDVNRDLPSIQLGIGDPR